MVEDTPLRSTVKAVSWRIVATTTTAILVYAFTGRLDLAVTVGILESIAKIILYVMHERVWNKLSFGRRPVGIPPRPKSYSPDPSSVDRPESDSVVV